MSPSLKFTARGGEYDAKMCRLSKRYLWGGGFPPARINHDTETREIEPTLPWGLKQLEITTLVACQEMYHRIALMSFLCRFPSWAYAWRWCRCCLLVSIIRVRHVASGMYVMNLTKNQKQIIGFKLNDGNLFPGQIPRRVLIQAAGKCCKRLL